MPEFDLTQWSEVSREVKPAYQYVLLERSGRSEGRPGIG